ncbi:DUF2147 domain-containing protein [Empedobacter falsenii]|jgi:uncharacterized protein (DUF2147 family)|uniref:DUF2147 domain-containing protein n=1 Tax=Empedobacter falsenii TaxID=343874 RepID=A0A376J2W5_9FLAO|nr:MULTISPECIES: DUF2147 domain-containing protein [Empedobacter]HAD80333.1 DUF2147 domain-containing protein [Flavobacteriaceae bacterium]MBW1617779.1 DUF2147 domain-containing protein [Empedobacter falsenii]MBY0067376.1 DUF2147 domain-containing protein [Empedobacter falsenii]MDH0660162.1 DUF2147 domain-containing protein [Empedobacter sp. GD03865]MDH0673060.1 DUF2147 domain-containing protein [Empedobacter sp. GD03861]
MKKSILFGLFFMLTSLMYAQSPIGTWKTIDDETKQAKSYVEIFEKDGKLYGKVTKILTKGKEDAKCTDCSGALKNKPILGMQILSGLKKDGKEWNGGKIIDPNSGKEYKAKMSLNGNDKLDVRGFIGISLVGRTQTWQRVK